MAFVLLIKCSAFYVARCKWSGVWQTVHGVCGPLCIRETFPSGIVYARLPSRVALGRRWVEDPVTREQVEGLRLQKAGLCGVHKLPCPPAPGEVPERVWGVTWEGEKRCHQSSITIKLRTAHPRPAPAHALCPHSQRLLQGPQRRPTSAPDTGRAPSISCRQDE